MKKYKHLTFSNRNKIETRLGDRWSLSDIAKELNCDVSTISREISRHTEKITSKGCNCGNYFKCQKRHLCSNCYLKIKCNQCARATSMCPDYIPPVCIPSKHLGLCNGCKNFPICPLEKVRYVPEKAQETADKALKETRQGFRIPENKINEISDLVSPLIKNGQSPYAARIAVCEELGISETTLYRLIKAGKLSAKTIDLPWLIKKKPPKKEYEYKHDRNIDKLKEGHLYEDFKAWKKDNPDIPWVEMDSVESVKTCPKSILTILFTEYDLQLGFLVQQKSSSAILEVFNNIESAIGRKRFRELFPVILTDNGTEFDGFLKLEHSLSGGKRTKVFFCRPYRSGDKGICEHNHTLIRRILPKGTDFTGLTQYELDLAMNNINSYVREKRDGLSPIDLAFRDLDISVINALHLCKIDPKKVNLTKQLLKAFYKRTKQSSPYMGESLYGPDFTPSDSSK